MLGIESVPDGLANGLLAGLNPVAGLYAYMFGMGGAALFTSSAYMVAQGTGAMAIVVGDVNIAARSDPARALSTLAILTGVAMIVAGMLRLGAYLRFVSSSVMTGFVTAIGCNIVLGQLDDFTGYESSGANRLGRALDLLLNFWRISVPSLLVGVVTVALIITLGRTRLGPMGLVVAVIAGSGLAAAFNSFDHPVQLVRDLTDVPGSLPGLVLPALRDIPSLLLPAISLAFVGLVQGAGVAAGFPNDDARPTDSSQDFVAQGAGNVLSGLFRGMPVGGSMSATSLNVSAGARSRASLLIATITMGVVIVVFSTAVGLIAMPSLAGLLMVVGINTIKPERVRSVAGTGSVALTVMTMTFVLTLIIPVQFAVMVGVGLSILMFVVGQSARLVTKRVLFHDDGRLEEVPPPLQLPAGEVVALRPYGTLFFATAPTLVEQMPTVVAESRGSVVLLRLRGVDEAGATFTEVLSRYASALRGVDSKLMIVTDNPRIIRQLRSTGVMAQLGEENVYIGTSFVGATFRRAHADAVAWVEAH